MNNKQTLKVTMFRKVALFYTKYEAKLMLFLALAGVITLFRAKMKLLDGYEQLQQTESTGETTGKDNLWQKMVDSIWPLARKGRFWAGKQEDATLERLFDVEASDFKVPDVDAVTLARNIYKGLNDNAVALNAAVNVTTTQIGAAKDAIDKFDESIGTPQQAQEVSQTGTEGLVNIINEISKLLHDSDDLLVPEFELTEGDMVLEYRNNRFTGNPVNRHTTITAHIYADAAKTLPILGAVMTLLPNGLKAASDAEGTAEIQTFKGGSHSIVVSAPGFADKTVNFEIKNGQHVEVEVVMGV